MSPSSIASRASRLEGRAFVRGGVRSNAPLERSNPLPFPCGTTEAGGIKSKGNPHNYPFPLLHAVAAGLE